MVSTATWTESLLFFISFEILWMACWTVEWSRFPKECPISVREDRVVSFARYMAMCRGMTMCLCLEEEERS